MRSPAFPPASTYRVQLSSTFTLNDLAQQIPYLAELGITDIYLSPIFAARPGSTHGYDIVDHGAIDADRGGFDGWERLCEALGRHSLGVVLDIVPNHMAADPVHNRLWRQMLREGPSSAAGRYFDVDWRPLTGLIRDKVLLPILDEPYGAALLRGRVALERFGEEIVVRCGALRLPLAAGSLSALQNGATALAGAAAAPSDEVIAATNADPQRIHAVLEAQHYRLAYWKAANDEINYRRFFDVNDLVAIRAEDETVFDEGHALALKLAALDVVHGLRVDHVDGLLDPMAYLQRL